MKRYITDWSHTGDAEIDTFKDVMSANIELQDSPCVGIFWYDPNEDELFGVDAPYADECKPYQSVLFDKPVRTGRRLHCNVWQKEYYRGKDKRFTGDYTKIPRGRVFCVGDSEFVVMTGKWIKQYPQVMDYILDEFNLPDNTKFKVDNHWDIGHGWSDKLM